MSESGSFRTVGDESVVAGRGPGQMGWYRLAAQLVSGKSVLDVGCGTAQGLCELQKHAAHAVGQELDDRLEASDVLITPIEDVGTNCYDAVVCIDVIEHVEDDVAFLKQLCRVARDFVFISTPLSWRGRKKWPYHVREYRLREFMRMLDNVGNYTLYKGTSSGDLNWKMEDIRLWLLINDLLNSAVGNLPMRVLQKLLPIALRSQSHQAAIIKVNFL